MKLRTKLTLGLMSSLLAASIATATEYTSEMNPNKSAMNSNSMGMMSGDMKMDPVATSTKHLNELKDKLNLTQEQQPAWQKFSTQVNDQAKKMAAMRDDMKSGTQSMPQTAPEHMAKMADMMKDRAQSMTTLSDALKVFYANLSSDQQATLDKMHRTQMTKM